MSGPAACAAARELDAEGRRRFPRLFSPLRVGSFTFPNRIFWPPWCPNWANRDGTVSERLRDLYLRIAESGSGVVYLGAAAVSEDTRAYDRTLALHDEAHGRSLELLCRQIEDRGAAPAVQLMHFGREAVTTFTGKPVLAPSHVPSPLLAKNDPHYRIHVMTAADIARVRRDFVRAAVLAFRAGIRLVQLQAAHGYLLNSFLSPYTNRREDDYGGSVENRARLLVEIVHGIRSELGRDVSIDVRLSVDEFVDDPRGLVPGDFQDIVPILLAAGVDLLNVSGSIMETAPMLFAQPREPEARFSGLARRIEQYAAGRVPVAYTGYVHSLETGERLLAEGQADLVGYGRAQFADNEFVRKSVRGERVHRCISCGMCLMSLFDEKLDNESHCSVNERYRVGRDLKYYFRRAQVSLGKQMYAAQLAALEAKRAREGRERESPAELARAVAGRRGATRP